MIRNTLLNKSGNPESLKKVEKLIIKVEMLSNECSGSLQGFVEAILQVVLFTILYFKLSAKEQCSKNSTECLRDIF